MIRGVTREQVMTDRENRMANGQDGPLAATPGRKPIDPAPTGIDASSGPLRARLPSGYDATTDCRVSALAWLPGHMPAQEANHCEEVVRD